MAQKNPDLQKKTLNLHRGDFERLAELFPDVEPSTLIRKIVHDFVERCEGTTPPISTSKIAVTL